MMTETKARTLAGLIGGEVVDGGVGVLRQDDRYALINEDAGAVYHDRHACHVGYLTSGSDPRGSVEAEEWGEWDGSERWARDLARVLGGDPWQSGGNNWLVFFTRPDGQFVVLGPDAGAYYCDRREYDDDCDGACWVDYEPESVVR